MTIEEALAHATKERDAYQTKVADGKSFYQEMANFWNIVVETLEKQIPKKPDGVMNMCPNCHLIGFIIKQNYCENCGQKLDWGDEDDD